MAKIYPVILGSKKNQNSDGTFTVYIKIFKGKARYKSTDYTVKKEDWDKKSHCALPSRPNYKAFNRLLAEKVEEYEGTAIDLERKGVTTSKQIKTEINTKDKSTDFIEFASKHIEKFNNKKDKRRYFRERGVLGKLKKYCGTLDIQDLDLNFLNDYREALKVNSYSKVNTPNKTNTIDRNMSIIRSIVNEVIKRGLMQQDKNPFVFFESETAPTHKDDLTLSEINIIRNMYFEKGSAYDKTRKVFLFAFNCKGIRFADVATMERSHIVNGVLKYDMSKTGKFNKTMILSKEALEIAKEYPGEKLFDLLANRKSPELFKRIDSACSSMNRYLKEIVAFAGIKKNVSTSVARRSYGQIGVDAMQNNPDKMTMIDLQKAFSHSSVRTTEKYYAKYKRDLKREDMVNKLIVGD